MQDVLLQAPKWSVFPYSNTVTTSTRFGRLTPLRWDFLNTGDQISMSHQQLTRLAPMIAPIMGDVYLDVDVFAVPLRVCIHDILESFNLVNNPTGEDLPDIVYQPVVNGFGLNPLYFQNGELLDYLGYPNYSCDIYDVFQNILPTDGYKWDDWIVSENSQVFDIVASYTYSFVYDSITFSVDSSVSYSLIPRGICNITCMCFSYFITGNFAYTSDSLTPIDSSDWDYFCKQFPTLDSFITYYGFKTVNNFYTVIQSILTKSLANYTNGASTDKVYFVSYFQSSNQETFPDFPIRAYNRIFIDWYANTQVVDEEVFLSSEVYNFNLALSDTSYPCRNRFWQDDYFTGSFPSSQVADAVKIPADGTVIDLANATATQRFLIRLGYLGKRFVDFAKGVFNVRTSDSRLQRSELISRRRYRLQISDVAQTSQSTLESDLANYSGRGISWGKDGSFKYFAEEPTVIMVICSYIPVVSYKRFIDPLLLSLKNTMDVPLPDFQDIGNDPIPTAAISGSMKDIDTVFAWNRRYYPFTRTFNKCTGMMRSYLHYWNLARDTRDAAYNQDFLSVTDADDLEHIFNQYDVDQFFISIDFKVKVSRPLHKYLHFQL